MMRFNNKVLVSLTFPFIVLALFIFCVNKHTCHIIDNAVVCSENSLGFDNNSDVAVSASAATCLCEFVTIDYHCYAQQNSNDDNDDSDIHNHRSRIHLTEKQNKELFDFIMDKTFHYIYVSFTNPSLGNCSCLTGIIAFWIFFLWIAISESDKRNNPPKKGN